MRKVEWMLIVVMLMVAGCGKKAPVPTEGELASGGKPADLIVGKWEPTGDGLALEFTKDGVMTWVPLIKGSYRFMDSDVIQAEFGNTPNSTKFRVEPSEKQLELTPLEGIRKDKTMTFKRVAKFSDTFLPKATRPGSKTEPVSLKESFTFKGHTGAVNAVSFGPDGELVASGGDDKEVLVWRRATGEVVARLSGHKQNVESVAFNPKGDLLASASNFDRVMLWDCKAWKEKPTKINSGDFISIGGCVAFTSDGTKLICSASVKKGRQSIAGQGIRIWDIQEDKSILDIDNDNHLMSLTVSQDGRMIAATDFGNYARVWDAATGKGLFARKASQARGIALSPDGKVLAIGWNGVELLNWIDGGEAKARSLSGNRADHLLFLPGGRSLLASYNYSTASKSSRGMDKHIGVRVINIRNGQVVAEATGHSADIKGVSVSSDGKWLATAGNDGLVKVWDVSAYGR